MRRPVLPSVGGVHSSSSQTASARAPHSPLEATPERTAPHQPSAAGSRPWEGCPSLGPPQPSAAPRSSARALPSCETSLPGRGAGSAGVGAEPSANSAGSGTCRGGCGALPCWAGTGLCVPFLALCRWLSVQPHSLERASVLWCLGGTCTMD